MAGPWEQYQVGKKPWEQFQGQQPSMLDSAMQPIKNVPIEISAAAQSGLNKITAPFPQPTGSVVKNLARGVGDVGKRAIGAVEYVSSPISGAVRALASQPVTDVAVSGGVPKQAAEDWIRTPIDLAANIAIPAAAVKYAPQISSGFSAVKNSKFMKDAGSGSAPVNALKTAFDEKRITSVQNLIMPKQTPAEVARTATQRSSGGGILNRQVYTPNPYEAEMIRTVSKTGVKPSAPLVDNIQILNAAKNKEAEQLRFMLEKANVPISPDTFNRTGASVAERIAANPLVDENSATVRKILEAAQKSVETNPKTAAGLLQARKDFDKAIEQFQPTAFDTDAPATAFRFAAKQVRQGFNSLVAESVPAAEVRASLTRQSHMYEAIDNMASKLSQEPTSRLGRFFKTPTGKVAAATAGAAGTYYVGDKVVGTIKAGAK